MSNRQARREQMRTTRQQRTQQQRPQGRPSRPGGPSRGGGGGGLMASIFQQKFLLLVAGLVIVLAGVLGLVLALQDTDDGGATDKLTKAREELPLDLANGAKLGKDDAPLKLAAFEDFQCPFCLKYSAEQEPTLINEYVKTGKVQIEFKHLPILGTESARAARASECMAEQNKFWQFHSRLFTTQAKEGQLTDEQIDKGRFSDGKLRQFAQDEGADLAAYDKCFSSEASLAKVQESQRLATSLGINATPGFTINGVSLGSGTPSSLDNWRKLLDDAIAQATASPSATASASASASPSASPTAAPATATPTKAP